MRMRIRALAARENASRKIRILIACGKRAESVGNAAHARKLTQAANTVARTLGVRRPSESR
jgi:hypothetical protein